MMIDCICLSHNKFLFCSVLFCSGVDQKREVVMCGFEDSDQPAHPRSLIGVFNGRFVENQALGTNVSSCGTLRL